jgi:hypothetical protein
MERERSLIPAQDEYTTILAMAEQIKGTPFCPSHFRTAAEIAACMLKARELGIPPMYGLSHIVPVQGKMVVGSEVMLALIFRAHGDDAVRWEKTTADEACVTFKRREATERGVYCFTMEDAKRAGVTGKTVWQQYPAAMLRARCISAVARMAFPDVIAGLYTAEELGVPVYADASGDIQITPATVARAYEAEDEEQAHEAMAPSEDEARQAQQVSAHKDEPTAPAARRGAVPRSAETGTDVAEPVQPDKPRYSRKHNPGPEEGNPLGDQISQKVLADMIRQLTGLQLKSLDSWRSLAREHHMYEPRNAGEMTIGWLSELHTALRHRPVATTTEADTAAI